MSRLLIIDQEVKLLVYIESEISFAEDEIGVGADRSSLIKRARNLDDQFKI